MLQQGITDAIRAFPLFAVEMIGKVLMIRRLLLSSEHNCYFEAAQLFIFINFYIYKLEIFILFPLKVVLFSVILNRK